MRGALAARMSDPHIAVMLNPYDGIELGLKNWKKASGFGLDEIRSASSQKTLFVGDSHMEQYWPRAEYEIRIDPRRTSAAFATYGACPPLPSLNRDRADFHCPAFYRYWTSVASQPDIRNVVIGAYWEAYFIGEYFNQIPEERTLTNERGTPVTSVEVENAWHQFGEDVGRLVRAGKRVFLLSSSPASPTFDPRGALRRLPPARFPILAGIRRTDFDHFIAPIEKRLAAIAEASGAALIRPGDYFCNGQVCPATDERGVPLYRDANHLRFATTAKQATFIAEVLAP
jgi:hypothetical protein